MDKLHSRILACRLCQDAGYIDSASPVVCEVTRSPIMLIGQAPGHVELEKRRPFQGRAGRELFRWMRSIGIDEADFRDRIYMTSITKCFPGKATSGSGDRRPSGREIMLCGPWLERQLHINRPRVILLIGGLAIESYFPKVPLTELVGRRFEIGGITYIPLPHPSGASRWLNVPAHRELLQHALAQVRSVWDAYIEDSSGRMAAG